jgi:hypothetical protein
MSGQQKRGFRLPWNAERGPEDGSMAATVDQGPLDSAPAAVGDELGDGPFGHAESEPALTMDAAPAASDVPDASAEAVMIETDSTQDRTDLATDGAWPTVDRAAEAPPAADVAEASSVAEASANGTVGHDAPAAEAAPEPVIADKTNEQTRGGKRDNPLVAGLVKAMREAAIASRAETTTRLQAEAAARIEAIRAGSTDEAAALRKRVDEDIANIREWSKVEMARIKAETEHRIEERRADAINESQRQLDAVEQQVLQVQSTVSAFEGDMDRFFEKLLAENDPARLAALAEQAPDAPDLSGELPTSNGWTTRFDEGAETAPEGFDGYIGGSASDESEAPAETIALEAAEAAEAEAAATEGLDLTSAEEWPASVMAAAARRDDTRPDAPAEDVADDSATTRLQVSGLTSVAGISAFKGAIGGLAGVRSVSVSTGERGVFIYTVQHEQETDLAAEIAELSAFAVEVTDNAGDGLSVVAHEPAA